MIGLRYQVGQSGFLGSIVWMSTRESRAAGLISVLATAEVIIAVTFAWAIYAHTGWAYHLMTSVLAIPFVMLRSEASVQLAHRMWTAWETPSPGTWSGTALIAAFACQPIVSVLVALGWVWLIGAPDSTLSAILLISTAVLVCSAMNITLDRLVLQGRIIQAVSTHQLSLFLFALSLLGGLTAVIATGGAELATYWSLVLIPLVGLMALTGLALGGGVSFLVASLAIRILSVARHPIAGLRELPANWRRTVFVSDTALEPELLPDIAELNPANTFKGRLERLQTENLQLLFLDAIFLVVWAAPTFLYRLSLKSTIWLYIPIILTRVPKALSDADGRVEFLDQQNRTYWERVQIAVAIGALAYAIVYSIDWTALGPLQEVRTGDTPLTPYHMLLVLDLGRLPWWNWVSVPSALLTLVLFFWIDLVRKRRIDPMGAQVTALLIVMNLRNMLAYAWIVVALYAFIGDAYRLCEVPQWIADLLHWHFGAVPCHDAGHDGLDG